MDYGVVRCRSCFAEGRDRLRRHVRVSARLIRQHTHSDSSHRVPCSSDHSARRRALAMRRIGSVLLLVMLAIVGCGYTLAQAQRSEEHTSELQSQSNLVCRLLLEKKKYWQNSGAEPHEYIRGRN